MNLGIAIRELRKAKGLTQAELARKARLSQTSLSQIENGQRPGSQTFKNICAALNVSELLVYITSMELDDVPVRKQVAYEKLFPVIKQLVIHIATDDGI